MTHAALVPRLVQVSNPTWLSVACVQPCKFQSTSPSRVPRFDFISLHTEQVATGRSSLTTVGAICHPCHYCSINCPWCSWQDARVPRLMFNVATPQINACLRKTRHANRDCWIVPLDSLWKCHISLFAGGAVGGSGVYLVKWLRQGSKLESFLFSHFIYYYC